MIGGPELVRYVKADSIIEGFNDGKWWYGIDAPKDHVGLVR